MSAVRKIAVTISAAGMLMAGVGATTAASASTGPAAAAAHSVGPTYVNMHSGPASQSAYIQPSSFTLLGGRPSIFTTATEWQTWFRPGSGAAL